MWPKILREAENEVGATPTAEATPAPEVESTPGGESGELDDFLQDDMDDTDDVLEEGTPEVEEPAPTVAPAESVAPAEEPAPTVEGASASTPQSVPVTPAVAAEPAPQTLVAPAVAPQPAAEPTVQEPEPQYTPEQVLDQYRTWRSNTIDSLATGHYSISEEQMEQLDENPSQIVPRLLAGVYMDAVTDSRNQMIRELPGLMQGALSARDVNSEREGQFYKIWPQLNTPEHRQTVLRMASIYRQINPTADVDTMTREVGAQVLVALRMPFDPNATVAPAATPAVVAPVIAAVPAFTPAAASSPRAAGGITPNNNMFTVLAEEDLAEDQNY